MIIYILQIAAGIVLLYIGGELLVRSAIAISVRFGISRLIIGLTVVALGTSLPELFVSVAAVVGGAPEIAAANIIGSNIINIALILPLIPLLGPLIMPQRLRRIDYPMMLGAFLLAMLLIIEWRTVGGGIGLRISFIDGLILLAVLTGYLVYLVRGARNDRTGRSRADSDKGERTAANRGVGKLLAALAAAVVGGVVLAFGSDLLVGGAEHIAAAFGVSKRIIALTVVAHGTNLPELFAAFAALRKKEAGLAFGNLVGSNIINTLFILGVVGVAVPLEISNALSFIVDFGALIVISLYAYVVLLSVKHGARLGRRHGVAILVAYLAYFGWVAVW